ncbi:MAG: shikimate dehydrogenase [Pararhodobacter sp.]
MVRLAAVLGCPISHSLSPRIHNHWISVHGLTGFYSAIDTPPAQLGSTLEALPRLGFVGVNVTLPLKQLALARADVVTENARRIGASNMLTFTGNGIEADNTDTYGFTWNIRQMIPSWRPSTAAVLGAGGAARAIVVALQDAGARQILLCNRTQETAQQLACDIGGAITVVPWQERHDMLAACDTLINTTSLGMMGKEPLSLRLDALPGTAVVNDIVYVPLETELLRGARLRGNPVVDGLGMLLHQAVPAFDRWFCQRPQVDETLRNLVMNA